MPKNWNISVGSPVLTPGMSFFVRYRKKTEQIWINFLPNPTTNNFTIPNLDDKADYEVEISTVCASGDISIPVYYSDTKVKPSVVIKWQDNQGMEERLCTQPSCNFTVDIVKTDPDNTITLVRVIKSTDGISWSEFVSNQIGNSFTDSVSSIGTTQYKVAVTDTFGNVYESNILKYKRAEGINVDENPNVHITIYKPDKGSHFIGQLKFFGLIANTADGSNITKVELYVKFRAIGINAWFERTETHIIANPQPTISLNRQFVYGFRDNSKYIGTRDWNGADNVNVQLKIYTSTGEVKIVSPVAVAFPWFSDYNQAIL